MPSTIQPPSYKINREHRNRPSPPKLWLIENKFTNYIVWRAHVHDMFERDGHFRFISRKEREPLNSVPSQRAKERLLSLLDDDLVPSDDECQYLSCRDIWVRLGEKFHPLVHRTDMGNRFTSSGLYETLYAGSPMGDYNKLLEAALSGHLWAVKQLFDNDVGEMVRNNIVATPICDQNPDDLVTVGGSSGSVFPPHTAHIYKAQKEDDIFWKQVRLFYDSQVYGERSPFLDTARLVLLISFIDAGEFGHALDYFNDYPYLSMLKVSNKSALTWLASNQMMTKRHRVESFLFDGTHILHPFAVVKAIQDFMHEAKLDYITIVSTIVGLIIIICCIPLILLSTLYWLPWKFLRTLGFLDKKSKEKFIDHHAIKLLDRLCETMNLPGTSDENFGEAFLLATQLGANVVSERILTYFPEAAFYCDSVSIQYIIHKAVERRDQELFAIIYKEFGRDNFMRIPQHIPDGNGNNILHLAAKLSPPSVLDNIHGSVLQLQHELKWFKEMENILTPHHRVRLNHDGKTPKSIFNEEHENLKDKAEKWMKDTSTSCTIIAALIGTIMFAAAITVPGGNDQNTGFPMFSPNPAFTLFAIFDGIAFLTSVVSLLMFMEIMMARYEVEDFIRQIPVRLFIGLGSLFISVFFMMLSFCFAVDLVFGQSRQWVLISGVTVASYVLLLFGYLQGALLFEMIGSTYRGGFISVHPVKNSKEPQQNSNDDPLDNIDRV